LRSTKENGIDAKGFPKHHRRRRVEGQLAVMEGRYEGVGWLQRSGSSTFREDGRNATPLLRGLPDDRCQSPHWGCVVEGRVGRSDYPDREEAYESGRRVLTPPPGHIPVVTAGTELIEFKPKPRSTAARCRCSPAQTISRPWKSELDR